MYITCSIRKISLFLALVIIFLSCKDEIPKEVILQIKKLNHSIKKVRGIAVYRLSQMGKKAVPALINELGNKKWRVKANAAFALARMGSIAYAAVPKLLENFRNAKNSKVKFYTSWALNWIGSKSDDYYIKNCQYITNKLKSSDPKTRELTTLVLGVKSQCNKAFAALINALDDNKKEVVESALSNLYLRISPIVMKMTANKIPSLALKKINEIRRFDLKLKSLLSKKKFINRKDVNKCLLVTNVILKGLMGGGYKKAKWGMNRQEVINALGYKISKVWGTENLAFKINWRKRLECYFYNNKLYKVVYKPGLSNGEKNDALAILNVLQKKWGYRRSYIEPINFFGVKAGEYKVYKWTDGKTEIKYMILNKDMDSRFHYPSSTIKVIYKGLEISENRYYKNIKKRRDLKDIILKRKEKKYSNDL